MKLDSLKGVYNCFHKFLPENEKTFLYQGSSI